MDVFQGISDRSVHDGGMNIAVVSTHNAEPGPARPVVAKATVAAVLVVALVLRLLAWWIDPQGAPVDDARQYHQLGANIAFHGVYSTRQEAPLQPSARRMPGYPAFLAVVYSLVRSPSPAAAKFSSVILGVLACWLVGRIAHAATGDGRVTLTTMALTAVSPPLIQSSASIGLEALFTPLLMAATYAAVRWNAAGSWRWACISGLLCGVLALIKPESLLLPGFMGAAIVLLSSARRRALMQAVAAGAVTVACVCPWVARNYAVCGRASLQYGDAGEVRGEGGQYLRMYRLSAENGFTFWPERYTFWYGKDWRQAEEEYQVAMNGPVQDASQSDLQFWLTHPAWLAKYTLVRFIGLMKPESWSRTFGLDRDFSELAGANGMLLRLAKAGLLCFDALCVAIGLLGLGWSILANKRRLWLVSATVLYFIAIYSLLHGIPRYRIPELPLMFLLASTLAVAVAERIVRARRHKISRSTSPELELAT